MGDKPFWEKDSGKPIFETDSGKPVYGDPEKCPCCGEYDDCLTCCTVGQPDAEVSYGGGPPCTTEDPCGCGAGTYTYQGCTPDAGGNTEWTWTRADADDPELFEWILRLVCCHTPIRKWCAILHRQALAGGGPNCAYGWEGGGVEQCGCTGWAHLLCARGGIAIGCVGTPPLLNGGGLLTGLFLGCALLDCTGYTASFTVA